jgi:predicted Rossmann fold flavoprotein
VNVDVVVLGAGAAGLMCAAVAARGGARVVLLEHMPVPGKKIRISGGGRCNFTNLKVGAENFISSNPNFARSALARYTPAHFVALVDSYHIAWHQKTLGQLFCDGSAQQIIDMLVSECAHSSVDLRCGTTITSMTKAEKYRVETSGDVFEAPVLVVATGGLSIPKMGATSLAYRIAGQFDVPVVSTAPALVPVVCGEAWTSVFGSLAGVSVPVKTQKAKVAFRENLLFTHQGLSGPAVLQISSYREESDTFSIDLLPDGMPTELTEVKQADKRLVRTIISQCLPTRLAQVWPERACDERRNAIPEARYREVLNGLRAWTVHTLGTEGYAKAEVTRGGIDTVALSSKTMEVQSVPGLYFIGECVDVTGWLGGYNFQWAWASAVAAGTAIAERISASS